VESAPATKARAKVRKKVRRKLLHEDKLGAWAIGQSVSRDFGAEGLFTGRVTAYRKDGETDLYELEYEDGDREEVGTEEYKLGLAL